jgi:cytosine/adenosine deaminase-related metal-dependent hydrolase
MSTTIAGVILLPTDGASAGPPVDLVIENGVIAAIVPAVSAQRRRLGLPALVNAHDHARPLSPTSFGAAGKPLETWLLRLAAMPAIDPYLGALAAFGRAARAGAGSVMAHYTRFHGSHAAGRRRARNRPRGRGCRRARHARRVHARWRAAD